jgi:hypothetical protein
MTKRIRNRPRVEDRRQRRERQVTAANRVGAYGLIESVQKRLREITLDAIMSEPEHDSGYQVDQEERFRHIGAEIAQYIVTEVIVKRKDDSGLVAIIDGVLATELRRYAQRVYRDEFDQARAPLPRPEQEALFS